MQEALNHARLAMLFRKELDLYANVRPIRSLAGSLSLRLSARGGAVFLILMDTVAGTNCALAR